MNSDSNPNSDSLFDANAALMARPAFRPSADWTRHLRPVNAPPPAWASPKPKPPASGETSPTSPNSSGVGKQPVPASRETSSNSPNSSGVGTQAASTNGETPPSQSHSPPVGCTREHPIPEDSILADYRDFVRKVSELSDGLIIAPALALCGKLLTPHVTLDFGGSKPLTIYNFMTTPAGLRKSTTFAPAEKIARQILMGDDLLYGNASDSALFDSFEQQPHRLQFEDEGNTLLRTWETSAHGREVSARYLKLYDGAPWSQNYLRERKLHEGSAERSIPQATLSLCIGSTFGVAQLDQLEAGSGLRRRFGFYLATQRERYLDWPETLDGPELSRLADLFQDLTHLKGVIGRKSFTPEAWEYWCGLQQRNRERCEKIPGYTSGEESLQASLNESPARCLKLAVIFQACRWAKGSIADAYTLTEDVLALAEQHQNACLDSLVELEATGRRVEAEDTAEWLLAQISGDHPAQKSVDYTRSDLTRRFTHNSGRQGALTVSRLYSEILPRLMEKGHCRLQSKVGRTQTYTFTWE
jgi:hypothetical protein